MGLMEAGLLIPQGDINFNDLVVARGPFSPPLHLTHSTLSIRRHPRDRRLLQHPKPRRALL